MINFTEEYRGGKLIYVTLEMNRNCKSRDKCT